MEGGDDAGGSKRRGRAAPRDGGSEHDGQAEARAERAAFVDVVGTEISAIWGNVTRLGGQCVAALYLAGEPRSMDDLAAELGRSKSNVFSNLRALESLGIVRRVRIVGSQRDHYELAGDYPDVLVVAFARHLSRALHDKSREIQRIADRLEALEGRGAGPAERASRLSSTYASASEIIEALVPRGGQTSDLGGIFKRVTPKLLQQALRLAAPSAKKAAKRALPSRTRERRGPE
jgi:DNA-binding transcriptional regulator GbsR (MarR family)